jgi:hypothetical protein
LPENFFRGIFISMNNDQWIRDVHGKVLGRIDGDWIRAASGRVLARVDEQGWTRTADGKVVGKGDQRLRVLERENS